MKVGSMGWFVRIFVRVSKVKIISFLGNLSKRSKVVILSETKKTWSDSKLQSLLLNSIRGKAIDHPIIVTFLNQFFYFSAKFETFRIFVKSIKKKKKRKTYFTVIKYYLGSSFSFVAAGHTPTFHLNGIVIPAL